MPGPLRGGGVFFTFKTWYQYKGAIRSGATPPDIPASRDMPDPHAGKTGKPLPSPREPKSVHAHDLREHLRKKFFPKQGQRMQQSRLHQNSAGRAMGRHPNYLTDFLNGNVAHLSGLEVARLACYIESCGNPRPDLRAYLQEPTEWPRLIEQAYALIDSSPESERGR